VLFGGLSAEREVSLHSGEQVLEALLEAGVDAHPVDVGHDIVEVLQESKFDRVFNVLHGRGGENGTMQALLEFLNIPYCSSGVTASALAMDKVRTKWIWMANGLPTPKFVFLRSEDDLRDVEKELLLPIAIKPVHEGSSCGVVKVHDYTELKAAYAEATKYHDHVMAEEWVEGGEYTIAIVADEIFPSVKITTPKHEFYDYKSKYIDHSTVYECPSDLTPDEETRLQSLSKHAYDLIGCRGWGRVDVMQSQDGNFSLLEVNTIPGMTETSLVPKAAKVKGLSFPELTVKILETSLEY